MLFWPDLFLNAAAH